MQFIVQRGHAVVVVNITIPKMFRCEIRIELFDCFAVEHLVNIDVLALCQDFILAECCA